MAVGSEHNGWVMKTQTQVTALGTEQLFSVSLAEDRVIYPEAGKDASEQAFTAQLVPDVTVRVNKQYCCGFPKSCDK